MYTKRAYIVNGSQQEYDMDRIVVVIPAYNEERFIGSVVLQARQYADTVIVVDDGSEDDTAILAELAGAKVISHQQNRGKGYAINTGFAQARQLGADVVVMLDADGQHNAAEISTVVTPVLAGEADIVVGSRYIKQNGHVPRHRIWGHRAFNFLTRMASGTAVSDSQSGFRAFSSQSLACLSFQSDGFSVESEMQFMAREHDLVLVEVPITITYPDPPKRSVIQHGLTVLNGILRLVGQYRPLFYFGLPGLLTLLFGLGWGVTVVRIFQRTHTLAVGYALISVLLFVMGSISLSTGIILHSIRALLLGLFQNEVKRS